MSTAPAKAAALLLRRGGSSSNSSILHLCCSTFVSRDGGATASASGRCTVGVAVGGRSCSSRLQQQQPLSTFAAPESATSPLQRRHLAVSKACPRGFAGSSPFSSSTVVEASSSSPSPSTSSSEPSPSFVRLNNIFPSPGSKSQVGRDSFVVGGHRQSGKEPELNQKNKGGRERESRSRIAHCRSAA